MLIIFVLVVKIQYRYMLHDLYTRIIWRLETLRTACDGSVILFITRDLNSPYVSQECRHDARQMQFLIWV